MWSKFVCPLGQLMLAYSHISLRDCALEKATYSCPWINTGAGRFVYAYFIKGLYLSFVNCHQICLPNLTRYWWHSNTNGKHQSDWNNLILGIITHCLLLVTISASIRCSYILWIIILVPLHKPFEMSKFLSSMIVAPIFKHKSCSGIPEGVRLLILKTCE